MERGRRGRAEEGTKHTTKKKKKKIKRKKKKALFLLRRHPPAEDTTPAPHPPHHHGQVGDAMRYEHTQAEEGLRDNNSGTLPKFKVS